ncbi:hypothetical protein [Pseudomonas sp. MYb118]|uniref:hypothetical protein n=1 Tax=Pseudomonas sp. MYb118 TaxID=1848720 RepID=UPI0034CD1BD2
MRADLDKSMAVETAALNTRVKEHYSKYGDDALMIASSYRHLTTASEWSLKSINTMIDSCRTAIFGGKLPDGAKKDTQPKAEVTAAIAAMSNLDLLIANAAFDAVQALLSSIGSTTSTNISVKSDEKMLAPGMTLFITVVENSYHRKEFCSDETIIQNLFLFEVRFSIKEGKAMSKLSDLQAYENQKQSMRNQLLKVDDAVGKLDPTKDDYLTALAKFLGISDALNARLKAIDDKLQAIAASAPTNTVKPLEAVGQDSFDGDGIVAGIKAKLDNAVKGSR